MIKKHWFLVQPNFTIHDHIFAMYSCPRLHFIDPTNINRANHFFLISFRGLPSYIKDDILKYKSSNFDSFIIFNKLSGLNVELITYTKSTGNRCILCWDERQHIRNKNSFPQAQGCQWAKVWKKLSQIAPLYPIIPIKVNAPQTISW